MGFTWAGGGVDLGRECCEGAANGWSAEQGGLTATAFPLPLWQGHKNYACTLILLWGNPHTSLLRLHREYDTECKEGGQHHVTQ